MTSSYLFAKLVYHILLEKAMDFAKYPLHFSKKSVMLQLLSGETGVIPVRVRRREAL